MGYYIKRIHHIKEAWAEANTIKNNLEHKIKNTKDSKVLRKLEKRLRKAEKKAEKFRRLYIQALIDTLESNANRGPLPVKSPEVYTILENMRKK